VVRGGSAFARWPVLFLLIPQAAREMQRKSASREEKFWDFLAMAVREVNYRDAFNCIVCNIRDRALEHG